MSASIPENYLDLFKKKAFGSLSTLMPDGSPQTNPVWVDYQNGEVWVNSAVGRLKDKNMKRDPRVSVAVIDPDNPYRFLEMRGRVREITQEGATAAHRQDGQEVSRTRTNIRSRNPASSACSTRSSPSTCTPWDRRQCLDLAAMA